MGQVTAVHEGCHNNSVNKRKRDGQTRNRGRAVISANIKSRSITKNKIPCEFSAWLERCQTDISSPVKLERELCFSSSYLLMWSATEGRRHCS